MENKLYIIMAVHENGDRRQIGDEFYSKAMAETVKTLFEKRDTRCKFEVEEKKVN